MEKNKAEENQSASPHLLMESLFNLAHDFFPEDLPPEFWEHLGKGLEEIGRALAIYAEHAKVPPLSDPLIRAYEELMNQPIRVGAPPRET